MTMRVAGERKALITRLVAHIRAAIPELLAVYRFGTWDTIAERPDSDLDLAVLARNRLDPIKLFDLAGQLARIAGCEVDLADLRAADAVFRAQVVSTGERLFAADDRGCAVFEDFVYSDYARLNEERRHILDDIRKRGSVYGG